MDKKRALGNTDRRLTWIAALLLALATVVAAATATRCELSVKELHFSIQK